MSTAPMKPAPQLVVPARVALDPSLIENDRIIEIEELRKFKTRLDWLADPNHEFTYKIMKCGTVALYKPGSNYSYDSFPDLVSAIDSRMHLTP